MSCAGMQTERLQWVRHLSHPCSMAAKQTAAQHKQEVMITQRSSPVNKLGLVRQLSRSQQGGEEEGRKEGCGCKWVTHANLGIKRGARERAMAGCLSCLVPAPPHPFGNGRRTSRGVNPTPPRRVAFPFPAN